MHGRPGVFGDFGRRLADFGWRWAAGTGVNADFGLRWAGVAGVFAL